MRNFILNRSTIFYFLIGILISSCKTTTINQMIPDATLKASLDVAKVHETGTSNVKYDPVTKANVIVYTETTVLGEPFEYDDNNKNNYTEQGVYLNLEKPANVGYGALGFGLEYIGKGAKFPGGNGSVGLNYLELPIHFIYHYPMGPGNVYGGLGPYFAYGVGGKEGDISSFGDSNGGFKRFDAGLGFMLGYKLNVGVSLDIAYDLGLANIEYADEDVKGHNRVFSINLGYQVGKLFAKKKSK